MKSYLRIVNYNMLLNYYLRKICFFPLRFTLTIEPGVFLVIHSTFGCELSQG